MPRFRFAHRAEVDLGEIAAHIARENPGAAARFVARMEGKCRLLAKLPMIGRRRDGAMPDLRAHPVGNYIIFYRRIEDGIEVVRVLHGSRDIDAAFRD